MTERGHRARRRGKIRMPPVLVDWLTCSLASGEVVTGGLRVVEGLYEVVEKHFLALVAPCYFKHVLKTQMLFQFFAHGTSAAVAIAALNAKRYCMNTIKAEVPWNATHQQ